MELAHSKRPPLMLPGSSLANAASKSPVPSNATGNMHPQMDSHFRSERLDWVISEQASC